MLTSALLDSVVKLPAQPTEAESQLRVFAPQTTYVVPLVEHNGVPYVGLFEVLEPLGTGRVARRSAKVEAEILGAFIARD